MSRLLYPGHPYPLGATWDGNGVNFALYADNAKSVELCLFKSLDNPKETRHRLVERTHHIWHAYVPNLKPGQLYGYRVHGSYDPVNGHRHNHHKLLIDPYATAIAGSVIWHESLFGYDLHHPDKDLSYSKTDSAPYVPKCVVTDPWFDWEGDIPLRISYHKTIIYETHIKGFTQLHPGIPDNIKGTYAAIAHPVTIQYLVSLGITAIELMPVHHYMIDSHLADKGLSNYWGYNSIGYFAPDVRYSSANADGGQVNEFKKMVKQLHKAGIEVILDVVYNHTGEGSELGPTVSFRGIDNASYYRLTANKRYCMDYTGTGNTLNAMMPNVLRLIMDSLRYWILDMHVDGFRFDLASTLARELHEVDMLGSFFDIIHQDPVISQVKLIAEPWDVGEGGYQVGKFPPGWGEWNGKYRDCIRNYWRGAESMLGEFAQRFTGSPDLYEDDYRRPTASINFVTAHDGFTLHDLVSYNEKRNMANGENNMDGDSHNNSWNSGVEGPTDNVEINMLREKQKRNFLTTIFLSQGVPMIVAGDELSRTQQGNNNAYCQDNEVSWIDWQHADTDLLRFTQRLIAFRTKHPAFRRRGWFQGKLIHQTGSEDIAWFLPNGAEMTVENWRHDYAKSLGVFLNGHDIKFKGPRGEKIIDDSFYIIFNAHYDTLEYTLPSEKYGKQWTKVLDTAENLVDEETGLYQAEEMIMVQSRSVMVLKQVDYTHFPSI